MKQVLRGMKRGGKGERKSGGEKVHDLGRARKDKLLKPERTVEPLLLLDCKNGLFAAQLLVHQRQLKGNNVL